MSTTQQFPLIQHPEPRPPRRPRPGLAAIVAVTVGAITFGAVGLTLVRDGSREKGSERLASGSASPTTSPTTRPEDVQSATTTPPTIAPTTIAPPTTSPPTTRPPTTIPERLTSASRLSLDGIGPVDIGMTVDQASAAAGVPIRLLDDPRGSECRYAVPDRSARMGDELGFMVVNGRIARIDVGIMGPDLIRTVSGIGKGSTEAEVQATYPGRIRVELHPYRPNGRYLVYVPNDASFRHLSMIFETVDGEVRSFRAGLTEQVSWKEGCS